MNLFSTPTMFLRRTNLPPLCGEYGRYNEAIHLKTRPVRRERKKKKNLSSQLFSSLPSSNFCTERTFTQRCLASVYVLKGQAHRRKYLRSTRKRSRRKMENAWVSPLVKGTLGVRGARALVVEPTQTGAPAHARGLCLENLDLENMFLLLLRLSNPVCPHLGLLCGHM